MDSEHTIYLALWELLSTIERNERDHGICLLLDSEKKYSDSASFEFARDVAFHFYGKHINHDHQPTTSKRLSRQ